jgi:hypothetical protein
VRWPRVCRGNTSAQKPEIGKAGRGKGALDLDTEHSRADLRQPTPDSDLDALRARARRLVADVRRISRTVEAASRNQRTSCQRARIVGQDANHLDASRDEPATQVQVRLRRYLCCRRGRAVACRRPLDPGVPTSMTFSAMRCVVPWPPGLAQRAGSIRPLRERRGSWRGLPMGEDPAEPQPSGR